MKASEFIGRLSRHYGKRHASDQDMMEWYTDIEATIGRTDANVLQRAFELIRDEWEERSFPLPAQLRKFIDRAAQQLHPELPGEHHGAHRSLRARDTPEQIRQCDEARAWQTSVIAKYGSWAQYWRVTKHQWPEGRARNEAPATEAERWRDVEQRAFAAIQSGPNKHLHTRTMTDTERKLYHRQQQRMTGERDE